MCEPTTLFAIVSVATAGVGVYAQHQTAKAQADAINAQRGNEREEALESTEEELGQRIRAARERRARARVAGGESGALGNSFIASVNQSLQDQDMDAALAQKNLAFSQRGTDDRANTALSSIRDPSAIEAGLNIATAGFQGYSAGQSIASRRKAAGK